MTDPKNTTRAARPEEEDPDLTHNAHPLAIRKAVAEAERASAKEATPSRRESTRTETPSRT